jgi:hypothetical protein
MGQPCLGLGRTRIASDYYLEAVALEPVKAAEREQLPGVIEKSFALDPSWNAALHMIDAQMKSAIARRVRLGIASWRRNQ